MSCCFPAPLTFTHFTHSPSGRKVIDIPCSGQYPEGAPTFKGSATDDNSVRGGGGFQPA